MNEEGRSIVFFLLSMSFIFLAIAHGIYFNFRYQKKLDKLLMGEKHHDGGFLYNYIFRMNLYGTACIFPSFARFIPNINAEDFKNIPKSFKKHLIINEVLLIFLGFGFFVISIIFDFKSRCL